MVLITGSSGQLGSELKVLAGNEPGYIFTDGDILDITDYEKVRKFIKSNSITHIINCAAYTAVDRAEEEKDLASLINYESVENLARVCKENDIILIHLSTDYVFDGMNYRPYKENDLTSPINHYGLTKCQGEEAIARIAPKSFIIRTSWVYSPYGKNFIKTMLSLAKTKDRLSIVCDQIGSPTYAKDLAQTILKLLKTKDLLSMRGEIFHYSNEGVCSWYDFAKAIFELEDIDVKVDPIKTVNYSTLAKRPHYSVLDKTKIKKCFDTVRIPYWKDSLKECLQRLNDE